MCPQSVSVRTCRKKNRIRIEFFFRFRRFGMNSISRHEIETKCSNYYSTMTKFEFFILVNFFFGRFPIDEYWRIHMSHCIALACMCVCVCARESVRLCTEKANVSPMVYVSCHCLLIVQVQGCDLTERISIHPHQYRSARELIGKYEN